MYLCVSVYCSTSTATFVYSVSFKVEDICTKTDFSVVNTLSNTVGKYLEYMRNDKQFIDKCGIQEDGYRLWTNVHYFI